MTVYGLFAVVACMVTVLLLWSDVGPFVDRYLVMLEGRHGADLRDREEDRARSASEREARDRSENATNRQTEAIPADLEAWLMEESERWRQEELRADVRARYIQYGDWNMVRRAVGIGTMDEAPT